MTRRRDFIKKSTASTFALAMPLLGSGQKFQHSERPKELTRPKRLKQGDVVGLIAPGYSITEEMLQNSIKAIKAMGMKPYHTQRIFGNHGYLSNTDDERTKDLMHMFTNTKVKGVFCIRGGYGCTRILDRLDFDLIAKNPKILLGYSDITALLNAFYHKIGLVGFHGAMGPEPDSYAHKGVKDMVMNPEEKHIITNYDFDEETLIDPVYERYVINPGKATGKLVGGNLSLLSVMNGTDYDIDYTDCLVCIEDVGEAPYRIDRMLTQLVSTPSFKKAAGILFGVCAGCDKKEGSDAFSLKQIIMDRIAPMGIPAVYGMSFGHITESFTFPIGIEATMNADTFSLQLQQSPLL
jgi:muramoyltetrapeptide carboxypeptidase